MIGRADLDIRWFNRRDRVLANDRALGKAADDGQAPARQPKRERASIIFATAIHHTRRPPPSHPLRTPLHLLPANLRRPDGSRLLLSVDAHPEHLADRH